MSITKYQIFLKTAACGSFSKAAEAMNFTQSGISHAINSLEAELGVTLLSRNRGGVVLTADGRALLPQVEKLCAAHHSMMQTVESLKGMDSGLVKVATFSSVSFQWLPRILKSFGQLYPNIEFEVVTGDFYDQIENWIVSGAVDCGFFRLPSTKHLQTYSLYRDELQVVVPCDHPLAQADPFPRKAHRPIAAGALSMQAVLSPQCSTRRVPAAALAATALENLRFSREACHHPPHSL